MQLKKEKDEQRLRQQEQQQQLQNSQPAQTQSVPDDTTRARSMQEVVVPGSPQDIGAYQLIINPRFGKALKKATNLNAHTVV